MSTVHRKTRTGCTQCKQRRVKCDERKPSCANCVRNKLSCSLEFLIPAIPRVYTSRATYKYQPLPPLPTADGSLRSTSLDTRTVELLHHYTATVHRTLATDADYEFHRIWRDAVPPMALAYNFLMKSTLAVSALHLAALQPSRRHELINYAIKTQHFALPAYRNCVARNKPAHVHAIFACSGFVLHYMMGLSSLTGGNLGRIPTRNDPIPHWFNIIRGHLIMLGTNWELLKVGPFKTLLNRNQDTVIYSHNPCDAQLACLHNLFRPSGAEDDENTKGILARSIEELRRVFCLPYTRYKSVTILECVHIWPGTIPTEFTEMLYNRRPEALVILAHYCVLLKRVNTHYYFHDVGRTMMEHIEQELDEDWKPYIRWALNQPFGTEESVVFRNGLTARDEVSRQTLL